MERKECKLNTLIKAEKVCFSFKDEEENIKQVLKDFDLEIEKGSFVSILGHNGSGKSTLARLFNCLHIPDSGTITVEGLDTSVEENVFDIRNKIGLIFQNPDNQIVASIVEEDVAFGPENLGVPPKEIRERVDEALKTVGMYDYRRHETHKLSGGQKQRVAIAGIIAMQPDCIIFDEPTAMLDPKGRADVMKTIRKLRKESGKTIVLITHYMDEAVQADRVVVMDSGKIIADDVPQKVFSKVELLKSVGLDVPQPTELCYRLQKDGINLPDVLTVDECVKELMKKITED